MELSFEDDAISISLVHPLRRDPHTIDLSSYCILTPDTRRSFLLSVAKVIRGSKYLTQAWFVNGCLVPFGRYLVDRKRSSLPDTFNDWQFLVLDLFAWFLSNPSRKASLETRCNDWDARVAFWLRLLTKEGVIPEGLVIPQTELPQEIIDLGSPTKPQLIGEIPARQTSWEEPINKTIAGPIFWRTDIEYLDEIETTLRRRNKLIKGVLDDYWLKLIRDCRRGKNMMRKIPEPEVARRAAVGEWSSDVPNPWFGAHAGSCYRLSHVKVPNSLAWSFSIVRHQLNTSNDDSCLASAQLHTHPALGPCFLTSHRWWKETNLRELTALSDAQSSVMERRLLFMRFLGLLNPVDIAVACAILIQEHPNINPGSILSARILNARGKQFLLTTDTTENQIFSVDKPRAGTRKYAILSRRAQVVLRHVIRATAPVRALLRRTGSKFWRFLFLGYSGGPSTRLGFLDVTPKQLWSEDKSSLARFYPELVKSGIGKGTFDFAKLRTTQGVLEWFETGSITKAARKLGNSRRIVLENYIPKPLLRLWNERIIRRFQNTLIVLAAHNEDYLLDVTDFQSVGELHGFLAQLIYELPAGNSPIANDLHKKFGPRFFTDTSGEEIESTEIEAALLTLRLDAKALALLYAFQRYAIKHIPESALRRPHTQTGLVPMQFIELAAFLAHAAESVAVGEALRESIGLDKLKRAHSAAQPYLSNLLARIETLHIERAWSHHDD